MLPLIAGAAPTLLRAAPYVAEATVLVVPALQRLIRLLTTSKGDVLHAPGVELSSKTDFGQARAATLDVAQVMSLMNLLASRVSHDKLERVVARTLNDSGISSLASKGAALVGTAVAGPVGGIIGGLVGSFGGSLLGGGGKKVSPVWPEVLHKGQWRYLSNAVTFPKYNLMGVSVSTNFMEPGDVFPQKISGPEASLILDKFAPWAKETVANFRKKKWEQTHNSQKIYEINGPIINFLDVMSVIPVAQRKAAWQWVKKKIGAMRKIDFGQITSKYGKIRNPDQLTYSKPGAQPQAKKAAAEKAKKKKKKAAKPTASTAATSPGTAIEQGELIDPVFIPGSPGSANSEFSAVPYIGAGSPYLGGYEAEPFAGVGPATDPEEEFDPEGPFETLPGGEAAFNPPCTLR